MKIEVNNVLTQLDGTPILDNDGKGNMVEATVKQAIVNAILSPVKNENGVEKIKKYELAKMIYQAEKEVELTIEDVKLIKDRVGELYAPIIVGQIVDLLEK